MILMWKRDEPRFSTLLILLKNIILITIKDNEQQKYVNIDTISKLEKFIF